MIPERLTIHKDVFRTWCVELQKMSDVLLIAAKAVLNEGLHESQVGPALHDANLHLGNLEEFARAVMEEHRDSTEGETVNVGRA